MLIPMVQHQQISLTQPIGIDSRLLDQLAHLFDRVVLREPAVTDENRWHSHRVAGKTWQFARPLTLTPYASAQPCSARCRFCSENLREARDNSVMSARLRPGPLYFDQLRQALSQLSCVPLSYSLSGLESTDDPDWLCLLLDTLSDARSSGPLVEGSVLYTNGAGLALYPQRLIPALLEFGLSWVEWSRHHHTDHANDLIMRLRRGQPVAQQEQVIQALKAVNTQVPVKLVCVVQRGGVASSQDVLDYVRWAHGVGIRSVIFREFSALPASYQANATKRYVDDHRVRIDDLLEDCLTNPEFRSMFEPEALTQGYYFWNARWRGPHLTETVFERANYQRLHDRELQGEQQGLIYKLVFHANGRLCGGWRPDQYVIWSADAC